MAQLCHCHNRGKKKPTCCWEKTLQDGQKSTKNHHKASLQWIRCCWKTAVNVHSQVKCVLHQRELRGCCVERSSSSNWGFGMVLPNIWIMYTKCIFLSQKTWSHSQKICNDWMIEIIGTEDCMMFKWISNFDHDCTCIENNRRLYGCFLTHMHTLPSYIKTQVDTQSWCVRFGMCMCVLSRNCSLYPLIPLVCNIVHYVYSHAWYEWNIFVNVACRPYLWKTEHVFQTSRDVAAFSTHEN